MTKRRRTNNDLQNITQKIKDRATRTSLNIGLNSGAPERQTVSAPYVATTDTQKSTYFLQIGCHVCSFNLFKCT